jgi:hypothetical protein
LLLILFGRFHQQVAAHEHYAEINEEIVMLVTFSCTAYADITLFGDIAVRLLKLMGHSVTIPGALLADDIPAALARLESALQAEQPPPEAEQQDADEDREPVVSLAHRAWPLRELLQAAIKARCDVLWDKNA